MSLKLMYITNDLSVALIAQKYGVDRVWIDLETLGKEERQKNRDSVKSHHTIEDIKVIAPKLTTSEMMVRINRWNEKSVDEIDRVIDAGAEIIMLPYWKTPEEVRKFLNTVNGKCKTSLLLETKEADECLDDVLRLSGIDEIHIGLNDLHLSYGLTFMFELLTNGTVERLCRKIAAANIPYGFGGIAKIGAGAVTAEKIILEHYRLGSTRAILSRSFCDYQKLNKIEEIDDLFRENINSIRKFEEYAAKTTDDVRNKNRGSLNIDVAGIVRQIKSKRGQ